MIVEPMLGVYYASQKNPSGGGWIAQGKTHSEAITNCVKKMQQTP
jgi:hypothetical protein